MTDETTNTASPPAPRHPTRHEARKRPSAARRALSILAGITQLIVILALLAGGAYAAWWFNATAGTAQKAAESQQGEEASRLVEVTRVRREDTPVRIRAMGTVRPAREAIIRPRVDGMIIEQSESFVPGGYLRAGEFMVQIDRADYEQVLLQRQTARDEADAALQIELGDQAVAREELELLEVDIPEINRELILRIPQVNQARARLRAAEALIERAQLDLERTRIVAPFDGHIVTRSVSVGNNIAAGDELARFVGAHTYWIEIAIPVSALRWIQVAPAAPAASDGSSESTPSPVTIHNPRAWGPGITRQGVVARIIGELEPGSRLARVLISIENPLARPELEPPPNPPIPSNTPPTISDSNPAQDHHTPELLLDSFVEVVIHARSLPNAIVIDRALVREGDVAWVMNEDDRLETRKLTIAYRGRDQVYVTDGLDDGDRVIRTNLNTPVNGMLLRLADPSGDAPSGANPPREIASDG